MEVWSVYLVVDGSDPQVGIWCDECQLPSVVKFPIIAMSMEGVGPAGTWAGCMKCEGYEEGEDGDPEADLVCG